MISLLVALVVAVLVYMVLTVLGLPQAVAFLVAVLAFALSAANGPTV